MFFWLLLSSFSSFGLECKKVFEKSTKPPSALVLGAGAFGLSFSQAVSKKFKEVHVLHRNKQAVYNIKKERKSDKLPQVILSDKIIPHSDWKPLLDKNIQVLALALPFNQTADFIKSNQNYLFEILKKNKDINIIALSKGFSVSSKKEILFIEDLLKAQFKSAFKKESFYVLSGPSFAVELAQGKKTVVSLAGYNEKKLKILKKFIETKKLKVITTTDVRGVAFAGAVKNIMAILAGMAKGLKLSQNSQTALMLQGTQELIRLGKVLGVKKTTYLGPAYLGDLILSLSQDSRNSRLGFSIGQGFWLKLFLSANPRLNIEGASAIQEIYKYTKGQKEYRLINALYKVLYKDESAQLVLKNWK